MILQTHGHEDETLWKIAITLLHVYEACFLHVTASQRDTCAHWFMQYTHTYAKCTRVRERERERKKEEKGIEKKTEVIRIKEMRRKDM